MLVGQKELASLQATHSIEREVVQAAKQPWSPQQSPSNRDGLA